jgi:hypothetical protein
VVVSTAKLLGQVDQNETGLSKSDSVVLNWSMEIPTRVEILEGIRTRVCSEIKHTLTPHEAVAVSLAATAPRDRDVVFGMLLNNTQAKNATRSSDSIAPTDIEWAFVFGDKTAPIVRDGGLVGLTREEAFAGCHQQLEAALRCSLMETRSKMAWDKALTKAGCYLALHSEDAESRVAACLGGIVRADSRRLDDVRSSIEDGNVDHMLLAKVVLAIAESIVP